MVKPPDPIILVDVDGVLGDFVGAVLDALHAITGVRHPPEAITTHEGLFNDPAITAPHSAKLKKAVAQRGFCLHGIKPYPDAYLGLVRLRQRAHVRILTAPWEGSPYWHGERCEWLIDHFHIPPRNVIFDSAKNRHDGDVLLDDRLVHLQMWQEQHPDGLALHWDNAHNRTEHDPRIQRVTSWREVLALVEAKRTAMQRGS